MDNIPTMFAVTCDPIGKNILTTFPMDEENVDGLSGGQDLQFLNLENYAFSSSFDISFLLKYLYTIETLKGLGDHNATLNVLDIGCSAATWRKLYYKNTPKMGGFPSLNYTGVDARLKLLKKAADIQCKDPATFARLDVNADLETLLDTKDEPYDVVIFYEVIEHLTDDKAVDTLYLLYRHMRPGGLLLLSTPNNYDGTLHWPEHHTREFTKQQMTDILEACGFTINDMVGFHALANNIKKTLGPNGQETFRKLRETMPRVFVDAMFGSALLDVSRVILYNCTRRAE